eukprot:3297266-Pleurochrysis_carterae.AAC.1
MRMVCVRASRCMLAGWCNCGKRARTVKLRRYRHFLRRGQIKPTGRSNLNHARLHLACTL